MSQLFLFAAGVLFTLTILLILAGAREIANHGKRIAALEQKANPESRHDLAALAAMDVAEVALFEVGKYVKAQQVADAQLENFMLKLEWMRARGNPDAPWAEIVRWKNKQTGGTGG